jgi:maltose alpha-D-glucosyltransferase/alpha-amylase
MTDSSQDWYKDAIFYEVYIRAFKDSNGTGHGDFRGLIEKLGYIRDLGVDCIWIMPHYPSPLMDDGYDIADYYNVHPDYGSLEEFRALVDAVHAHGLKIITDLVLNHTSDQHYWFQQARASRDSPFRDYYVWSDSDDKYQEARIIFLDSEFSNWSWDELAGQYYWHRFYSTQPDLNFNNPQVQEEMIRVAEFWLEIGLDGFRADAVPYLFEQEGSVCENQPETHVYLKRLRRYMEDNYPGTVILSEANQWPEDVRPYFGDGDEVHMNFHFPLMPRVFMSLRAGDSTALRNILARTPEIPENCQWCTFLRNHDELTLEMVTPEDRAWMWQEYAPEPRMRLNLGIRRRLAPLLDDDPRKIMLANSLLLTLTGSPVIYYGDEIGMGDNIWLKDRDGVRTPMQWDASPNAGFSAVPADRLYNPLITDAVFGYQTRNVAAQIADPDSLLARFRQMVARRKAYRAFGRGDFAWASGGDDLVLAAYWRTYQHERVLLVHNLTADEQTFHLPAHGARPPRNILTGEAVTGDALLLAAHSFYWLDYTPEN